MSSKANNVKTEESAEYPSPFRNGKTLKRTPPGTKYPAPAPPAPAPLLQPSVNTEHALPAPLVNSEIVTHTTPQNPEPKVSTSIKENSVKEKLKKFMYAPTTSKSSASPLLREKKLYNPKRQASVSPDTENPHVKKQIIESNENENLHQSTEISVKSKDPNPPPPKSNSPTPKSKAPSATNSDHENTCEFCEIESNSHQAARNVIKQLKCEETMKEEECMNMRKTIEKLTIELENCKTVIAKRDEEILVLRQIIDGKQQELENTRTTAKGNEGENVNLQKKILEASDENKKLLEVIDGQVQEMQNVRTSAKFYEGENANLHKKLLDASAENKSQKEQINNLRGVIAENEEEKIQMLQKLDKKVEINEMTENIEILSEKTPNKVPTIAILTTSMGRGLDVGLKKAGFDVQLHMYEGAKIETLNNKALEIFKDDYKPEKIIIYGGGNDARWRSAPEIMKEYKNFIKTLQALCPKSKILIMQIPPRNHHGKNPGSWNRIRIINDSLKIHVRDVYMSQVKETLHESHRIEIINPMPDESEYFRTNDGIHFDTNGVKFTVDNLIRICNLCPNFCESPAVQITAL